MEAEIFPMRTDRQTDMTKPLVTFHNSANAPKPSTKHSVPTSEGMTSNHKSSSIL